MDDKEKLGPAISFRLPKKKHNEYQAAALAAGISLSTIIRRCLADSSPQVIVKEGDQRRALTLAEMERMAKAAAVIKKVKSPKSSEEKRRLLYLFNKASNNLNQIAHKVNVAELAGRATTTTYAETLEELQIISDMMREVIHNVD